MIDFVHAADLHLDSPITFLPQDKALKLRRAFRDTLTDIIEYANNHRVALLLLSGDLFDKAEASYDTAVFLARALERFSGRVFIAPGNHDPYTSASPYRSVNFSDNVHIFTKNTPEAVALPELNCTVYGAAFNSSDCASQLLSGFCAQGDRVKIGVFHGQTGDPYSAYNPIMAQDIAESGLDYLALGHVHSFSGVLTAGKTSYAYPGCPQGRGFDEPGQKGVIHGRIENGQVDCKFVNTGTFTFSTPQLDITGMEAGQIMKAVLFELDNPASSLCKITLTGHHENPDILAGLEHALQERLFYTRIVDKSRVKTDIWQLTQEDTLTGRFMKIMLDGYENAPEDGKELIEAAAKFGLEALKSE